LSQVERVRRRRRRRQIAAGRQQAHPGRQVLFFPGSAIRGSKIGRQSSAEQESRRQAGGRQQAAGRRRRCTGPGGRQRQRPCRHEVTRRRRRRQASSGAIPRHQAGPSRQDGSGRFRHSTCQAGIPVQSPGRRRRQYPGRQAEAAGVMAGAGRQVQAGKRQALGIVATGNGGGRTGRRRTARQAGRQCGRQVVQGMARGR